MRLFHRAVVLCAAMTLATEPLDAQAAADSLYRRAQNALEQKNYDSAAGLFESIVARYPRSTYAPDALYWRGFSLYKNGNLEGAEAALEAQASRYPNAPTRADAAPLLILVKGELAKRGDREARREVDSAAGGSRGGCEDMEVRVAALDALQQMDSDRVLPLLRRVMARRDECSAPLRKNALFILAQKGGAERDKLLLEIAKGDPNKAVRNDAVFYLGQTKSDESIEALEYLLVNDGDNATRSNALFALAQMRTDRTRRILQGFALRDGAPNNLRNDALFHLSQESGQATNAWLKSVIANGTAPLELRKNAVFHLAQKSDATDELSSVYDTALPVEIKKDLLFHIAQRRDDKSMSKLIAIAKGETNKTLQKDALFYLGQSKDPRAMKALEDLVIP
jgi:tetratricopeptide (TPR) repeat protein